MKSVQLNREAQKQSHRDNSLFWFGLSKAYVQSSYQTARALTNTKTGTIDYFWSGASLSNLSFTTRKIDPIFNQVIAHQAVLAAQATDIVFD